MREKSSKDVSSVKAIILSALFVYPQSLTVYLQTWNSRPMSGRFPRISNVSKSPLHQFNGRRNPFEAYSVVPEFHDQFDGFGRSKRQVPCSLSRTPGLRLFQLVMALIAKPPVDWRRVVGELFDSSTSTSVVVSMSNDSWTAILRKILLFHSTQFTVASQSSLRASFVMIFLMIPVLEFPYSRNLVRYLSFESTYVVSPQMSTLSPILTNCSSPETFSPDSECFRPIFT